MESLLKRLTPLQLAVGSGVTFPILISSRKIWVADFNKKTWKEETVKGWYPTIGDTNLINENLQNTLLYQIGARLRQEEFGSNLEACLEEPCTQVLVFFIENNIRTLFAQYENRITFKSIQTLQLQQGQVYIQVHYQVKDTPVEEYLELIINKN